MDVCTLEPKFVPHMLNCESRIYLLAHSLRGLLFSAKQGKLGRYQGFPPIEGNQQPGEHA